MKASAVAKRAAFVRKPVRIRFPAVDQPLPLAFSQTHAQKSIHPTGRRFPP